MLGASPTQFIRPSFEALSDDMQAAWDFCSVRKKRERELGLTLT
jgi:hypothetical protein